jgi:replicative DNA helicase
MGKTTFVMNMAHHIAAKEGIPVGFFSLEVSKEQLIDQLLAIESGVDSWKLRTGALDEDDFPRINEAMAELSEAPLYIDDSAMTNVMEMRTKARRLQAEHGLGLSSSTTSSSSPAAPAALTAASRKSPKSRVA